MLPWLLGIVGLVLVYFARLYFSSPIDSGGDSFAKWYEAKRLFHGFDFTRIDHHTMRWAIMFPVYFVQKVFGTAPWVYYITPAAMTTLLVYFQYQIVSRMSGKGLAILAAGILFLFPEMVHEGIRMSPDIFSVTYMVGAVYYFLRYVDTGGRRLYLVLSALFLLFAYGTKVTSLFVMPAFVYYLWLQRDARQDLLVYLGVLFIGFVIETIWINSIIGEWAIIGRLVVLQGHVGFMDAGEKYWYDLFHRWIALKNYWYLLTAASLMAAVWYLKRRASQPAGFIVALVLVMFALFSTFAISGFDPLRFIQNPHPRYLLVMVPLGLILVFDYLRRQDSRLYLVLFTLFVVMTYPRFIADYIDTPRMVNSMKKVDRFAEETMEFFEQGYALAFRRPNHARLYRAAYLDDRYSIGYDGTPVVEIQTAPRVALGATGKGNYYLINKNGGLIEKGFVVLDDRLNILVKMDYSTPLTVQYNTY